MARELRKLGRRHPGLQVLVLAGGEPLRPQANALEKGVHIAVGTPGRVFDHLRRDILRLDQVRTLVLDEADRMLDMGFQEHMEEILSAVPEERQTVFFSATFPVTIEALSRKYQRNALRVEIESEPEEIPSIRQLLITTEQDDKPKALRAILLHHPHESALVFANLKTTVARARQVADRGRREQRLAARRPRAVRSRPRAGQVPQRQHARAGGDRRGGARHRRRRVWIWW